MIWTHTNTHAHALLIINLVLMYSLPNCTAIEIIKDSKSETEIKRFYDLKQHSKLNYGLHINHPGLDESNRNQKEKKLL